MIIIKYGKEAYSRDLQGRNGILTTIKERGAYWVKKYEEATKAFE